MRQLLFWRLLDKNRTKCSVWCIFPFRYIIEKIILNKGEYIIEENNYNYKVNVQIKNQKYETKYYKDKIIEGGKYKTLVIMIGEGAGNNYWSILYPEYYGIGFEEVNTGNVTYKIWLFEKIKEWLD